MSPFDQGVVLITGASSGIGWELARQLASRAKGIALVARRRDRLETLRAELLAAAPALRVSAHACDLTSPPDVDAMLAEVRSEHGAVDVLVNNAGFGDLGVFDRCSWEKTRRMIDTNVTALTYLTHALVGSMVARGRGGILNVSSGFGLNFGPGMAAYIGTKHYVTGFTEGLRLDLAGTGVVVTQICPGPVATEFADNIGNFTGMAVPKIIEITAERCARAAIAALDKRRALVVPGILIRFLTWVGYRSPRWMTRLFYRPAALALRKKQETAALPE